MTAALDAAGFAPARTRFGYDTTLVTRIDRDDAELQRCFRERARRAVRKALKAGVEVMAAGEEEAAELDRLYQEMVSRKGAMVDRATFRRIMDDYYQARGWDLATGLFKADGLRDLGLADLIPELEPRHFLA